MALDMPDCRMYEEKYPALHEVVMVTIQLVSDLGVWVELLEYGNIQGFINIDQVTRRRIRCVQKLLREGAVECTIVIRTDEDKGYVELSRLRITPEEKAECLERYALNRVVAAILGETYRGVSHRKISGLENIEDLYRRTAWHYGNEPNHDHTAAYDVFKGALTDPNRLSDCDVDASIREVLHQAIVKKIKQPLYRVTADISLRCFEAAGIDAIKEALQAGQRSVTKEGIKVVLMASPRYEISSTGLDKVECLSDVKRVVESIKCTIESLGGQFDLITKPQAVTFGVVLHDKDTEGHT